MPQAKLTSKFIDSLPFTSKGQVLWFDTYLRGFGVCVGMQSKTYFAQRDVNGKSVRVTIGKHGVFTTDQARNDAKVHLIDMSHGTNPNTVKKEVRVRSQTLEDLYKNYVKQSSNRLKERTLEGYEDHFEHHFEDWKSKPIADITKEMIEKRHKFIGDNTGEAAANNAMKFLRTLFNFARFDNDALLNPVSVLSQKKRWYKIDRRRSIIKDHQLKPWYEAVMALKNHTARDVMLFLLFTGLRKREAMSLQWKYVDLKAKTFVVPDTKNNDPLELPLSDYLEELLTNRKKLTKGSAWVFPGRYPEKHLEEFKRMVTEVETASGVTFMPHDLRRTFITIAERLDISTYALKSLVNHKSGGGDVTAGYIIMNVERLREPMQKIAAYILDKIHQSDSNQPDSDGKSSIDKKRKI